MTNPRPGPSPSHARPLRRELVRLLLLAALVVAAFAAWRMPFMDAPRAMWELARMPVPATLPVPVQGVAARGIAATFGAPRGVDRRHDGVDIFAARGTAVRSATRGIVLSVRESAIGGKHVWVIGPARERHYYAHLDAWAPALERGAVIQRGEMIGEVGDTGNARGTPPHLHYGIYAQAGALDPLPRLLASATALSTGQPTR